jgi:hypothetical protein
VRQTLWPHSTLLATMPAPVVSKWRQRGVRQTMRPHTSIEPRARLEMVETIQTYRSEAEGEPRTKRLHTSTSHALTSCPVKTYISTVNGKEATRAWNSRPSVERQTRFCTNALTALPYDPITSTPHSNCSCCVVWKHRDRTVVVGVKKERKKAARRIKSNVWLCLVT